MKLNMSLRDFERQYDQIVADIRARPLFKDNTPGARAERIRRSAEDFDFFCETYYPQYCTHEPASFHIDDWPKLRKKKNDPWQAIAFRGSGKTARLNLLDSIHAFIFDSDVHFALYGGYNATKARLRTAILLAELQDPRLEADFGVFTFGTPKPATDDFVVNIPGDVPKSVKVMAISIGQDPRGITHGPHRPDFVRLDDIQSRRRAKSRKLTKEAVEWILKDLYPALAEPYSFGILATPLGGAEIWLEEGKYDNVKIKTYRYPAEKNGRATWPAFFPMTRLRRIKGRIGTRAYKQEYRLILDKDDDETPFSEGSIVYYDPLEVAELHYDYVIAWLDPSLKKEEKHDYKALVVVGGALGRPHIDVLWAWIKRTRVPRMIDAAYQCYEAVTPMYLYWEDNGGQGYLQESWDHAIEKRGYALPTRPETNTVKKEVRIESTLSAPIENGIIRFHPKDRYQKLLVEQLVDCFDGPHDDGPDALEGAVRKLQALLKRRRASLPRSIRRYVADTLLSRY